MSSIFLKSHHNTKFGTLNCISVCHISESRAFAGIVDEKELEITKACDGMTLVLDFVETGKVFRKVLHIDVGPAIYLTLSTTQDYRLERV